MAKKKYTLTKRDICDLYDITSAKLEYHIQRKPTKQHPMTFPAGQYSKERGCKLYNKANVEKYAKAVWTTKDAQKPLKLTKPITKAELAKELEPGLNALFGAAAQKDAAFDEEREADNAVVRVLEEKMHRLEEDYARSSRFNMVLGAVLVAMFLIYIFRPWMVTPL